MDAIVPNLMQSALVHKHTDSNLREATNSYAAKHDLPMGKVLIVDDEPLIVSTTRMLLKRRGCETVGAFSADDAADALQRDEDIGVLVTDIRMPGTHDGRWLIQWVKKHRPNVHIVVVSAFSECLEDLRQSCEAVFYKPINTKDFAHEITLLLLKGA